MCLLVTAVLLLAAEVYVGIFLRYGIAQQMHQHMMTTHCGWQLSMLHLLHAASLHLISRFVSVAVGDYAELVISCAS